MRIIEKISDVQLVESVIRISNFFISHFLHIRFL